MIRYAITTHEGLVIGTGTAPSFLDARESCKDIGVPVLLDEDQSPVPFGHYFAGRVMVETPARPGPWADWNGAEWFDPRPPEAVYRAAMAALRSERDRRLTASDWTQMADAPLNNAQREAWREYRTALRDLTETTPDLENPVWPTPPKT